MSKFAFIKLLDLTMTLKPISNAGNSALPPALKLSAFLNFLRTNMFQRSVGSHSGIEISQSATCQAINSLSHLLASNISKMVSFPSIEESHQIAHQFYEQNGFPPVVCGLIGMIFETHQFL